MLWSRTMPPSRNKRRVSERFHEVAEVITGGVGTPWAMGAAALVIIVWAVTGPIFGFSDTWQLVINTGTTIVTFLMVFVIQTSQNREAKATQIKLDELIRATSGARNERMLAELQEEEEMDREEEEYAREAHAGSGGSRSQPPREARAGRRSRRRAARGGP
jgi:low affinity Fe/Cu permease